MKNVIIISDTHGNRNAIDLIGDKLIEADYVFHLGDIVQDVKYIKNKFNSKVISVEGNCDFGDSEMLVKIEKVNFFLCHGHKYSVKSGLENLRIAGLEKKVDICLFGHTHNPIIKDFGNIILINPGAMSSDILPMSYCFGTVVGNKFLSKIVSIN